MSSQEISCDHILVGYSEIALKSEPVRREFLRILTQNIEAGLQSLGIQDFRIYRRNARILIQLEQPQRAFPILSKIFGIAFYAPCYHLKLDQLQDFIRSHGAQLLRNARSFAVRVRRQGKHPFSSQQLESLLGSILVELTGLKVDLTQPELSLHLELRGNDCYLYTQKFKGPGGLPLGTAGKLICLVSGGIDSPVAAWMMMKRGAIPILLFAQTSRGEDGPDLLRFIQVASKLKEWCIGQMLSAFVYRHDNNQAQFREVAPKYTCVLCRRMMYRVANALASKLGAQGIVTGESLAQVASQTLDNLRSIDSASQLPVFRPLIGLDKLEIEQIAKQIGSYQISISRTSGCGSLRGCWARPAKPATKSDPELIAQIESKLDLDGLLEKSIQSLREITESLAEAERG